MLYYYSPYTVIEKCLTVYTILLYYYCPYTCNTEVFTVFIRINALGAMHFSAGGGGGGVRLLPI